MKPHFALRCEGSGCLEPLGQRDARNGHDTEAAQDLLAFAGGFRSGQPAVAGRLQRESDLELGAELSRELEAALEMRSRLAGTASLTCA
jgi:hypothetical protein